MQSLSKGKTQSDVLDNPDFLPAQIDFENDTLTFVPISREAQGRLTFLDSRFVRADADSIVIDIAELLAACTRVASKRPLHFILHGAFCGSTLMARHFQELPHCRVLKEPGLLAQLARSNKSPSFSSATASGSWNSWLNVALTLLARTAASDVAVIIKPNDVCNWMGELLLEHDKQTRIIFLSAPLRIFLLSVLKEADRRRWARGRIRQLKGFVERVPFLRDVQEESLSDGQCGAALWLLNNSLFCALLERAGSGRVRSLLSEDLIAQPRDKLSEAAEFFGLAGDEANRAALAMLAPLSQHAKHFHIHYDADSRARDKERAEQRFRGELETAMSWADGISSGWLSNRPFPIE